MILDENIKYYQFNNGILRAFDDISLKCTGLRFLSILDNDTYSHVDNPRVMLFFDDITKQVEREEKLNEILKHIT